jgi:hypothetical protein
MLAANEGPEALGAARARWESTELVVLREFDLTA